MSSTTSSAPPSSRLRGGWIIAGLVALLVILHQDNWFWSNTTAVGFMPIGLFWHVLISIGASLTWWLATRIAWPVADPDVVGEGTAASTDSDLPHAREEL